MSIESPCPRCKRTDTQVGLYTLSIMVDPADAGLPRAANPTWPNVVQAVACVACAWDSLAKIASAMRNQPPVG